MLKFIKKILEKKKVKIFGGNQRMNYIFVDDVIDAINLIINKLYIIITTYIQVYNYAVCVFKFDSKHLCLLPICKQ